MYLIFNHSCELIKAISRRDLIVLKRLGKGQSVSSELWLAGDPEQDYSSLNVPGCFFAKIGVVPQKQLGQ
jgi:hypothetical protein